MNDIRPPTIVEALQACYEMWAWIAEKAGRRKEGWPGMAAYVLRFGEMPNDCPLCHYVGQEYGKFVSPDKCQCCPIKWTKYCDEGRPPCCHDDSPFERWGEALNTGCESGYALEIANKVKARIEMEDGA